MKTWILMGMLLLGLTSCANIPKGVVAVNPFDAARYAGKWYEIARLDFRFERNLINTTAEYTLNENGTIRVENRGYDTTKNTWKKAVGKAKLVGKTGDATLKVSFFGPFYSGYNVIALAPDYKSALVAGKDLNYLWILSREKTLPENVRNEYLEIAQRYGFKTKELVWVKQDQ